MTARSNTRRSGWFVRLCTDIADLTLALAIAVDLVACGWWKLDRRGRPLPPAPPSVPPEVMARWPRERRDW